MRYNNSKLLVVGTTPDYIDLIRNSHPERAIFLTDEIVREKAHEPRPRKDEEILCDLDDRQQTQGALLNFLCNNKITIDSICCFDCEAMELTAAIAGDFSLSYPSIETIRNCRDKYISKKIWKKHGLQCPESRLIHSEEEIDDFAADHLPCVIKPLSGTGSELVFKCLTRDDCHRALTTIADRCKEGKAIQGVIAEEFIEGVEYSCDFILENDRMEMIRLTRKLHAENGPFGTIRGYILADPLPPGIEQDYLQDTLLKSAQSLGLERAICMIDFIVNKGEIFLIELSPRPGGDCLPFLLKHASGVDTLTMALDFAQERELFLFHDLNRQPHACVRLHAAKAGILKKISVNAPPENLGVIKIQILKSPGHVITMPPQDYDSWLLGHIIFKFDNGSDPAAQADKICAQLNVEIRENHAN